MRFGSSHLRFVPVVLRGRPGTSACSSAGEPTTSKPGRPRMSPYCSCVLEIRPYANDADQELSLAIYNAVVPRKRVSIDEVPLVHLTGARLRRLPRPRRLGRGWRDAGRPDVAFVMLTVLPDHRRRGVGTALYGRCRRGPPSAACTGSTCRSTKTMRRRSPSSERRGFQELERNRR